MQLATHGVVIVALQIETRTVVNDRHTNLNRNYCLLLWVLLSLILYAGYFGSTVRTVAD